MVGRCAVLLLPTTPSTIEVESFLQALTVLRSEDVQAHKSLRSQWATPKPLHTKAPLMERRKTSLPPSRDPPASLLPRPADLHDQTKSTILRASPLSSLVPSHPRLSVPSPQQAQGPAAPPSFDSLSSPRSIPLSFSSSAFSLTRQFHSSDPLASPRTSTHLRTHLQAEDRSWVPATEMSRVLNGHVPAPFRPFYETFSKIPNFRNKAPNLTQISRFPKVVGKGHRFRVECMVEESGLLPLSAVLGDLWPAE